MPNLKDTVEKHPVIFYFTTVLSAFLAGWGAFAGVLQISNAVVLTQFEYATLSRGTEKLDFAASSPPSTTLVADPYDSIVTIRATGAVEADSQADHVLRLKVDGVSKAEVKGHKGSKDTDPKIALIVSASVRIKSGKESQICLDVAKEREGVVVIEAVSDASGKREKPPDTWAPRYTLEIVRRFDVASPKTETSSSGELAPHH